MRDKDTFITRCLRVCICIFVPMILFLFADTSEKTQIRKSEEQAAFHEDDSVQSIPDVDPDFLIEKIGTGMGFFTFGDLNADGHWDLIFLDEKAGWEYIADSRIWSSSQQKFVQGPEELNGCVYYAAMTDRDSRVIRVDRRKSGSYEKATYQWSDETEFALVKALYGERTETGMSIRMVRFCDGAEQVLTDCEYDTARFPYYMERNFPFGEDIFDVFYRDDPVWEETICAEHSGRTYKLYYAQNVQHGGENEADVTGYEGHLWVTDEDTRIVNRLFWQSEVPYTNITWEASTLFIRYADGSDMTFRLSEICKDPAEAVYEKSRLIDYRGKEYPIDIEKYDAMTDQIYKDAYYRAVSCQDMVRTSVEGEVYLKEYWGYQGDPYLEDELFLENLINNTKFYYMDFDGDGLPELVMDIIGDGLHILKYLPEEKVVEVFFGYERAPYFHLLGSGQVYYENGMLANKKIWKYLIVDEYGQDSQIAYFEENADYRPHREDEDEWWDMSYWVYLGEELGMVQVDEKRYREIAGKFFDAVEHAVTAMTFDEIFGERFQT